MQLLLFKVSQNVIIFLLIRFLTTTQQIKMMFSSTTSVCHFCHTFHSVFEMNTIVRINLLSTWAVTQPKLKTVYLFPRLEPKGGLLSWKDWSVPADRLGWGSPVAPVPVRGLEKRELDWVVARLDVFPNKPPVPVPKPRNRKRQITMDNQSSFKHLKREFAIIDETIFMNLTFHKNMAKQV